MINENHKIDLENYNEGKYDSWINNADGLSSVVIILDQFTKYIFKSKKEVTKYNLVA